MLLSRRHFGVKLLFVFLLIFLSFEAGWSKMRGLGTLRVRIGRFSNPHSKTADGKCCSYYRNSPTCKGLCKTFFRICAAHSSGPLVLRKKPSKLPINLSSLLASTNLGDRSGKTILPTIQPNYSISIDYQKNSFFKYRDFDDNKAISVRKNLLFDSPRTRLRGNRVKLASQALSEPDFPCTFGTVVTNVVANSSLEAEKQGVLEVDFPFKSPWPVSFKLLIEAWNSHSDILGLNKTSNEIIEQEELTDPIGTLVARHVSLHTLNGNGDWRPFKYSLKQGMTIHYSIKVSCQAPFFGNKCSSRCDSLRSSKNNRVNCTANGEVRCLEGWKGDSCNKAICREDCHSVHGYCTQPGECKCALGWRGKNCDECVPLPGCKHGFCSKTSYECICEPGWEGSYCAIPVCREGCQSARGYCKLPGECRCRIGWSGDTCESCKSLPGCVNGYCTKPLECRCLRGWTGIHCDKPICKPRCNKVNGYCIKPGECRCQVGWWGENCDTCYPYPGCKHGTCERPWECNCKPGWKGMLCNQRALEGITYCERHPNTCLNGGTCVNVPDDRNFTCSCPAYFTGRQCDYLQHSRVSFFPIINRGSSASRSTFSTILPLTLAPITTTTTTTEIPTTTTTSTTTEAPTTTKNSSLTESTTKENATTEHTKDPTVHSEALTSETSTTQPATTSTISEDQFVTEENHQPTKRIIPHERQYEDSKISVSVSTSVSMSTSAISGSTESPFLQSSESTEDEPRNGPKMAIKVTRLGPIETLEAASTEANTTDENFEEEPVSPETNVDPKTIELDNRRRKYLENFSIDKFTTTKIPRHKEKSMEDDIVVPSAEELYAEISKLTSRPQSPPVVILQLSEQNGDFESTPQEENSPNVNQITSQFLRDSSPHHKSYPASVPLLVTQDDVPAPSSFRSSPYVVSAGFDSFPDASSLYPYEDFINLPPQTRINRRTGKAPRHLSLEATTTSQEKEPTNDKPKEKKKLTYYEEHYNGRVHIGDVTEVDGHPPLEEIVNAFIELKKLRS